jgi:hypothetical protein
VLLLPALTGHGSRPAGEEPTPQDLLQLQQEVALQGAVQLLPTQGLPRWYSRRVGKTELVARDRQPAELELRNWQVGVLDLLPQAPWDSYRLSAEVNVYHKTRGGVGGLCVASTQRPAEGGGWEQWWLSLTLPNHDAAPGVVVKLHRYLAGGAQPGSDCKAALFHYKPPKGRRLEGWQSLRLDVRPAEVTAYWEGEKLKTFGHAQLEGGIGSLAVYPPACPARPTAEELLRGGLGLYNEDATTVFRNVILEPLQ